ncbi:unnamed protein product [Lymnaea stagnalis]|uniref:Uncharacterized protein n=1 Tax=Lymnaea stagnalis TaxID=6523 RepID=A0AAV2HLT0_LYMST
MDPTGVLADKDVLFRGIWGAGYQVSDRLVRSISSEFASKPSRPCKLILTTSGLTLERLPSDDGKTGKLNEIAFSALRDVTSSPYNPSCLLVVYVDAKSHFSVLVCSSDQPDDLGFIQRAFKKHKNWLLQNRPAQSPSQNSTLTQSRVNSHGRGQIAHVYRLNSNEMRPATILTNGSIISQDRQGSGYRSFSDSSDVNDGDVFMTDESMLHQGEVRVDREPVDLCKDGHPEAYHVGVQTLLTDRDSDTSSITSSSSIRDDIHSLSEEMKAIKFLLEKATGISAEEYYRRRDVQGYRHAVAYQPGPKALRAVNFSGVSHENGASGAVNDEVDHASSVLTNGHSHISNDYDLRSISAQTDKSSSILQRSRYAKKPVSVSTSNAYKEKVAALRKRGGPSGAENGSTSGFGSFSDGQTSPSPNSPKNFGHMQPRSSDRSASTSRTTVSKSIEEVYMNRPQRGSLKKRVIFQAAPQQ